MCMSIWCESIQRNPKKIFDCLFFYFLFEYINFLKISFLRLLRLIKIGISIGSICGSILTPFLRTKVKCFDKGKNNKILKEIIKI